MSDSLDSQGNHLGDHDPDGDSITLTNVMAPQNGNTQIIQYGNHVSESPYYNNFLDRDYVTYSPDAGFYGQDTFNYTISDGGGKTDTATVTITVRPPQIKSVEWIARTTSPLDANPSSRPGGGLRIFPDRDLNSNADRSLVNVRVTLTAAVANFPINYRVIDVDDPSSDTYPVDNESNYTDNRNTPKPYPIRTLSSDSNGRVQSSFRVSLQPGDNYRVVASTWLDRRLSVRGDPE